MRKKVVAGNWKMNKSLGEAKVLLNELSSIENSVNTDIIVCMPYPYLFLENTSFIKKGAQNVSEFNRGAYTGEVSAEMLKSMDVEYCIVGHSERRKFFNEGENALFEKVFRLIENEITPIFCLGELLEEREENKHLEVIKHQLNVLFRLSEIEFKKVMIAYEPVWAIGTGKTATNEQAEEIHLYIRNLIKEKYDEGLANETIILYGGSCNALNASGLFKMPNIDGGLIGGASLSSSDFKAIISAAN
jgi:triosephosphate isomerase